MKCFNTYLIGPDVMNEVVETMYSYMYENNLTSPRKIMFNVEHMIVC